ncbi:MAG: hypothetical protein ACLTSZ_19340 [Lachnospiraceae bacterium]
MESQAEVDRHRKVNRRCRCAEMQSALQRLAHEDTGFGIEADKVIKNVFAKP